MNATGQLERHMGRSLFLWLWLLPMSCGWVTPPEKTPSLVPLSLGNQWVYVETTPTGEFVSRSYAKLDLIKSFHTSDETFFRTATDFTFSHADKGILLTRWHEGDGPGLEILLEEPGAEDRWYTFGDVYRIHLETAPVRTPAGNFVAANYTVYRNQGDYQFELSLVPGVGIVRFRSIDRRTWVLWDHVLEKN